MQIRPQPNSWECGPFALAYALLAVGVFEDPRRLSRIAGTNRDGTDEVELGRAAKAAGCELLVVRHHNAEDARRDLQDHLERRVPVLLCVNNWYHWVTVMHHDDDRFVVFDSRDPAVVRVMPWNALRPWWRYDRGDETDPVRRLVYDLHPVLPRRRARRFARFTVDRALHLRNDDQTALRLAWSEIATGLFSIAPPPGVQFDAFTVPLASVLHRRRRSILRQAEWREHVDTHAAGRTLDRCRFVAQTYALQVPVEDEIAMVPAVAGLIGRWASAREDGAAA